MNSTIGYTITSPINCHILFEHKITADGCLSYCTVCNKDIKANGISAHIKTLKHQIKFFDNYRALPILDDAFIIKNGIKFEKKRDDELFYECEDIRQQWREIISEMTMIEINGSNAMSLRQYNDMKLIHVMVPIHDIKYAPLSLPSDRYIRNIIEEREGIIRYNAMIAEKQREHQYLNALHQIDDEIIYEEEEEDDDEYEEEV